MADGGWSPILPPRRTHDARTSYRCRPRSMGELRTDESGCRTASCIAGTQPSTPTATPTGMHRARRSQPASTGRLRSRRPGQGATRRRRVAGWTLLAAAFLLLLVANGAAAREWQFDVSLDGLPIGTHDISLQENGDARSVVSEMHF